ncbi:hypothetical protein BB561_003926 [Smittium simulii]|uniref:DNA 3'-5' helicase n=1 Tax=Smittium simulii TaxID=133385 RepID=A0A2T9YIY0_9FUNG|nr:hypothetical protein BB561_003926 [Smittium simulii]
MTSNNKEEPLNTEIHISPTRRFFSHALSGIAETDRVLVSYDSETFEEKTVPVNKLLKNTTSMVLLFSGALCLYKRRQIYKRHNGLVSLVGAWPSVFAWTSPKEYFNSNKTCIDSAKRKNISQSSFNQNTIHISNFTHKIDSNVTDDASSNYNIYTKRSDKTFEPLILLPNAKPQSSNKTDTFQTTDPHTSKAKINSINITNSYPAIQSQLQKTGNLDDSKTINKSHKAAPFSGAIPTDTLAPTGSGKTGVMELSMFRMLKDSGFSNSKTVYIGPTKALCSERFNDWNKKLAKLGIECIEYTGDTEKISTRSMNNKQIIVTTPESWDVYTRKWKKNLNFMKSVKLLLIDEVHFLQEQRGAVIEVSRMKMINPEIRFIAVSATISNIDDLALWVGQNSLQCLGAPCNTSAKKLVFGDEYRSVPIKKVVLGFSENRNSFLFQRNLDYRVGGIIDQYSDGKSTLVFCCTRKATQDLCLQLSKHNFKNQTKKIFDPSVIEKIQDKKLQVNGIAYHHAGMSSNDRQIIESMFIQGVIYALCTTSTLSVGVNLPAHLVIIKGTMGYNDSSFSEYSKLDILQMLGRAGRPQFDTYGIAVVLTVNRMKHIYETMLNKGEIIESTLHKNLSFYLSAEICLGNISNKQKAIEWLKTTFLAVRLNQNSKYYIKNITQNAENSSDALQTLVDHAINEIAEHKLIELKSVDNEFIPNEMGIIMCRYYIKLSTFSKILSLKSSPDIRYLFEEISKSSEFEEFRLQQGEKTTLTELNKNQLLRYPIPGNVKELHEKIFILIQCHLLGIVIQKSLNAASLNREIAKVCNYAKRICKCVIEYYIQLCDVSGIKNSLSIYRYLSAECFNNCTKTLRQLEKIGPQYSAALLVHGIKNLVDVKKLSSGQLESYLNRNPPFGAQILSSLYSFPEIEICANSRQLENTHFVININVFLKNYEKITPKDKRNCWISVLVASSEGHFIKFARAHITKLQTPQSFTVDYSMKGKDTGFIVYASSDNHVGNNVEVTNRFQKKSEFFTQRIPEHTKEHEKDGRNTIGFEKAAEPYTENNKTSHADDIKLPNKRVSFLSYFKDKKVKFKMMI